MPFLTKEELEAIFATDPLTNGGPFWSRVADNVEWTVMGSSPGCGHYTNLKDLRANTIEKLMKFLQGPPQIKMVNVFFGGEHYEWTTMELEARGVLKSGEEYHNHYALVIKWNEEGKVIQVRDYLDTALIERIWSSQGET
ncbi:hypothetical protein NM208_g400 [Fusarium decemcellulare]|uniref:Uncharacterized protein n=2 Tax=Fusarium decemcellulare TaxID=57161 RepID=A0ACC1SMD0_9HYPO|nr:hypothetical protein NM208_g3911 [Fusarium decemcellulare]KAJ3549674.1 hypothetical protein NM208_g400 [Fusarium decemcellulare]